MRTEVEPDCSVPPLVEPLRLFHPTQLDSGSIQHRVNACVSRNFIFMPENTAKQKRPDSAVAQYARQG